MQEIRQWIPDRARRMLNGLMSDVTRILQKIDQGDPTASDQLLPLVYDELRRLARARMSRQPADHTLQATALVHEAYVRLVDVEQAQQWDSRGHFFGAAAEAMRRILVDHARRKQRVKHGGAEDREAMDVAEQIALPVPDADVLAVHEALERLEVEDPATARIVKLRFFAGCSMPQIAEALGRPLRSVERDWRYARSWLHREVAADT